MKEEMTKLNDNTGKRKLLIITAETGDVSRTSPFFGVRISERILCRQKRVIFQRQIKVL